MTVSTTTIRPASVRQTLREAWRLRRVWWFTATARTRARFVRTFLGSFWLGLSNLFSIAALAAVYGTVFKVQDFNTYVVYLGIGLVVWNTIASAIGSAPNLFEHNQVHVHNTNLNPIFYTLEEWAFQLQTFLQSFLLVLLALSFFQPSIFGHLLLCGWLPLLNLALFVYWLPLLVCLFGARYRDLYQLIPILLQLVFLLSPILYKKDNLGPLAWTANLNPLYRILSPVRHSLMTGQVHWSSDLLLLGLNVLGIWIAIRLLNRERPNIPFLI
ncbi:ABC transporter permease [Synechococcus sp. BS55D]|uniref:ABC transporter permease n=1 Tax=Synechococcus sp. BS55D TaxID=2055943 RepID=UPI00103A91BA|nr:ABC transporter permease [Synechococcus sp. BS55D]TCD58139.1 phosphate ABC transporter permease [Synechococcus sp. BS55D]